VLIGCQVGLGSVTLLFAVLFVTTMVKDRAEQEKTDGE
jgi:hypothetical protein